MGDVRSAIAHHQRALELYEHAGDRRFEPFRLYDLSLALLFVGDVKSGLDYASRLQHIARDRRDAQLQFETENCFCLAYSVWRRWERVPHHAAAALSLWQDGMNDGNIYVLNLRALAEYHLGQLEPALATLRVGEREAARNSHPRPGSICTYNSALVHYMSGRIEDARAAAERAAPRLSTTGLSAAANGLLSLMHAVEANNPRAEVAALLELAGATRESPDLFGSKISRHARCS
jgi:hypothetical protein